MKYGFFAWVIHEWVQERPLSLLKVTFQRERWAGSKSFGYALYFLVLIE
jgi:hypothetical protein